MAVPTGVRGVFVGLATLDVVHYTDRAPGLDAKVTAQGVRLSAGGPAANAAVTFAALAGHGSAVLVTAVGGGPAADLVRADLAAHGVTVHDVAPDASGPSAVSAITVRSGTGERSIVGTDAATDRPVSPPIGLLERVLDGADVLLLDGHHPLLAREAARLAVDRGVPVVVDLGRWKPVFDDLAPHITHAVCSADARPPGAASADETAAYLRFRGVPVVVATAGAGPVVAWCATHDGAASSRSDPASADLVIEVPPVAAVDTLGAGDAFHGAYAHAVARGAGIDPAGVALAVRAGIAVASERVRHRGPREWLGALATAPGSAGREPREGARRGAREGARRESREDARRGAREGARREPREGARRGAREGARREPRETTTAELVARAARLAVPGGPRRILGIAGAPGAGKSHLAEAIVAELGPERAVYVPMDGFHLANAVLRELGRRDRKGAPDTFDGAGYVALLRRLRAQRVGGADGGRAGAGGGDVAGDVGAGGDAEDVVAPVYDRSIEEAIAGAVVVRGDVPLVVTEGNYLLLDRPPWRDARALLDEVWHLEPPRGLRLERLVARHVAHGKEPDAAREWALGSDERNARLVAAVANRADAVWRLVDPVGDDSVGDDLVDDGPTGDRSTGDGPVGDRVSPAR